MSKYVSFRRAPGFNPISKELFLGSDPKTIPHTSIPAYVIPDVITPAQEGYLLNYMGLLFNRLPFEEGHVDRLIHHYKEFYRSQAAMLDREHGLAEHQGEWPKGFDLNVAKEEIRTAVVNGRNLAQSFIPKIPVVDRVHFLQLHTSGFIRAHVDESRNSSGCVAGITLGTARVMTLTHPKYKDMKIDLLLAPRAMYVIAGTARTEWEHSVDWEEDDPEHLERAAQEVAQGQVRSEIDYNQPVMFDGKPSGFYRGTRNALIFRGLSPMDLFLHRMKQKENQ